MALDGAARGHAQPRTPGQGPQRASATYELNMSFDFRVPNRIVRYFSQIAMRRCMRDFKSCVEKTRGARPAAGAKTSP